MIRYWRTMCVDFAGKERKRPEKWGLRNAKLRTSRKILFAGGLLPVFECRKLAREHMAEFLCAQLRTPPTDRIAQAFLNHDAADPGGRALGAYDDFLGRLDDDAFRDELKGVTRETSKDSQAFMEAARLGKELERGLLGQRPASRQGLVDPYESTSRPFHPPGWARCSADPGAYRPPACPRDDRALSASQRRPRRAAPASRVRRRPAPAPRHPAGTPGSG